MLASFRLGHSINNYIMIIYTVIRPTIIERDVCNVRDFKEQITLFRCIQFLNFTMKQVTKVQNSSKYYINFYHFQPFSFCLRYNLYWTTFGRIWGSLWA